MSKWGANLYGNPCAGCGFQWDLTAAEAVGLVRRTAEGYHRALASATGIERHPALSWTPAGYAGHVGDNLRIWASYLAGARLGGRASVSGYDPDLVGQGRRYCELTSQAALWSLDHAVAEWEDSVMQALAANVVLQHSDRGPQSATDIARNGAHDVQHHLWDIERILKQSGA